MLATPLLIREDRARLDVQRLGEGVFLLSVFSIGFLLIVSGWLSRYLTEPLFALERGTRQIAAGRLSFRLPAPGRRDEVGRLQQAFNTMAERLDTGQRALEREKSRVQAILASVGAGVVALDERGIVRLINERAEALLGESSDEVIDRSVHDLSDMEGRTADFWSAVRAYHDRSRTRDRDLVLRADGRQRHFHIVAAPLRDGAGRERGLVVAFEDITDNVQSQRVLAWGEMARQVAHEIKNPLTPMKLSVQHLRRAYSTADAGDEDKAARFAGLFERITSTLIEQIDTLARIANEFSTFARMPTRVLERLDLNAVAGEAVALMQEEATAELVVDLHPEPLVVEADREELRRIYINLIKNAIQAIPEDRPGRVEVTTALLPSGNGAEGWAYSQVIDNGTGVPAELHDKIFEPNFSTKTSGTGLGLAITRKSIEEVRGEIGFDTEEGTGSTFWLKLPLVRD